jgi:hypothetical protein
MAEKMTLKVLSEELDSLRKRLRDMEKDLERKLEKALERATDKLKARVEGSEAELLKVRGQGGAVDTGARRRLIEHCAFLRAERRGFVGGSPEEDWLEAEMEIDQLLLQGWTKYDESELTAEQTPERQEEEKRV